MARKIFPGDATLSSDGRHARERLQGFYDDCGPQNAQFQAEAHTDALVEAGDQRVLNSLGFSRTLSYMDMYTSNKVRRQVNMVSGIQRRGRKSMKATPNEASDQKAADQLTKVMFNVNNTGNVLETISDAHEASLITGLTLLQLWVDYRHDPISGDIKVDLCPFNTFMIDSDYRDPDLKDCRGIWKRSYLSEEDVKSLLPEHKKRLGEIAINGSVNDGIFPYLRSSYWKDSTYMSYDEFYYRDYRLQKKLIDTNTGQSLDYRGQDDDILPLFLKKNPTVIMREVTVPTVKLLICVNGHVFYDDFNPLGIDEYPFAPFYGYHSKNLTDMDLKFQGIVRGMRDNQFLFNLMTSLEVEYVQSRVNPGIVYKPTSMVNPKDVAKRDLSGNFAIKKGANIEDLKLVTPYDMPNSISLIREQAGESIVENNGNEELLGSASNENLAGFVSKMRQEAGKVSLEGLFDALDRSQKLVATLELLTIQANYTPGKIARIIEEDPAEQFYNKTFSKFDVVLEDGLNTATQREQEFAKVMMMRQQGINIPDMTALKASTIQNKQEIIEDMQAMAEKEAEVEQQTAQINQQLQQAESDLATSQAGYNVAKATETMSKVADNETQALTNLASAKKDNEQAVLNKAKTLKELEDMDLAQLKTIIEIMNVFKATTNQEVQQDDQGLEFKEQQKQQQIQEQQQMQQLQQQNNQEGF